MRHHLRLQLIVIIVLTVSFFSACAILYGMYQTKSITERQSYEYGFSLAQGIATACGDVIASGNYMDLRQILDTIGHSYPNIQTIDIFVGGVVVSHYPVDESSTIHAEKSQLYTAPITFAIHDELVELGNAKVTYSTDSYYSVFVQQIHVFIIAGIGLLLGITLLLLFLLSALIIKPLGIIDKGTKIIADGNLSHSIALKSKNEIGRLAESFNAMTLKLQESRNEIEQWNKLLESRVQKRTAAFKKAHEKLRETQYELIQSGKMATLGTIGAGVAHELNNPMACIIGYSELMLHKMEKQQLTFNGPVDVEKYISTIAKESKRCANIVKNLLTFSRKQKTELQDVNIKDVVETTLTVMDYQTRHWHIDMSTDFCEEDVLVEGNGDKLQQVFINMISNAHSAMPDGGNIHVIVSAIRDTEVPSCSIAFSDTGCGIEKEHLDKLFESFFSTNKTMTNLGLGLSISHQIIKEHKGKIEVASELGKGTTFTIIMPLKG